MFIKYFFNTLKQGPKGARHIEDRLFFVLKLKVLFLRKDSVIFCAVV